MFNNTRLFAAIVAIFTITFSLVACSPKTEQNDVKTTFSSETEASMGTETSEVKQVVELKNAPEWVDVDLIDIDGASRRGIKLDAINGVVIHYVANPKSTAKQNRNYFNNKESGVSSHFIVGLDGEVIQCVPLDEKSSASNDRNHDTISIENCHPDESGKFNENTYNSLVKLTAWILKEYDLTTDSIIRHHDVTGKNCPKYFVEHVDEWEKFKADVADYKE